MNQKKIGLFLRELRKEKNLTQEELAEQLNVAGRTVSRWETGRNMPDVSIMIPLCEILGISINELLSGEKIAMNKYEENAEMNFEQIMKAMKKKLNENILLKTIVVMLLIGITFNLLYDLGVEFGKFLYTLLH